MSNLIYHFIGTGNVPFTPANKDEFTLNFTIDTADRWKRNIGSSNNVVLPEEGYRALNDHMDNVGIQQAIPYRINIANQSFPFMVDFNDAVSVGNHQAEVNIKPFKSKNNIITDLENTTWTLLKRDGKIKDSDMIDIPYVIVKDNQAELMIQCAIMMYVLGDQLAETIANTARLVSELTAAATPSTVISASGGTTINIGLYIKYALLIALELAKAVLLTLALIELTKQMFELILPSIRYYKAMTFDRLLTIGLASQGLKYTSTVKKHFQALALIPIPINVQKKKFYQVLGVEDQRVLNEGYPTSNDSTPTVMSFIDEVCKMYNITPRLEGNTLILDPKGTGANVPTMELQHNMNDQEMIEQNFELDITGVWRVKILSYTTDGMDKMLWDNPVGLQCEYHSKPNNISPYDERTIIKGLVDLRIPFALCTIKQETKVERELKKVARALDSFLGTNLLNKVKKRDGVMAVSSSEFGVTKIMYQRGGKQVANYVSLIGANSLYKAYHKIDEPKNQVYQVFNAMPIGMNNEQFLSALNNNFVNLEGLEVELINVEYNPEYATADVSYRKRNLVWGKNIITELVYER